jgi:hypothetical protein
MGDTKNYNNTTTPIFIGLNKQHKTTRTPQGKGGAGKDTFMFPNKCILM